MCHIARLRGTVPRLRHGPVPVLELVLVGADQVRMLEKPLLSSSLRGTGRGRAFHFPMLPTTSFSWGSFVHRGMSGPCPVGSKLQRQVEGVYLLPTTPNLAPPCS